MPIPTRATAPITYEFLLIVSKYVSSLVASLITSSVTVGWLWRTSVYCSMKYVLLIVVVVVYGIIGSGADTDIVVGSIAAAAGSI